ncbi:hypothetical protein QUW17_13635 [Bacteroides gallinaceum]|uniref:hypothetical protein n=1 Tax=Bacteroides gallinaceum TaxID=1462571 RepID=UPI0025A39C47|nr:hypothetical protein [Bacteroides gallinaceum]MDM8208894.1 hypothetical protein [Bacteroides gallinaceum]
MQNQDLNLFRPRRVAAKIHYSMISQFMFIWVKWNRPCDLSVKRSKQNPEYLGICFDVENNDTIDMMCDLKTSLKIEIIDL